MESVEPPSAPAKRSLRLLVPEGASPGVIGILRHAPLVVQHARNRGTTRRIDSLYYDTEDRGLFAAQMCLRVHRQGKRFIQTLKPLAAHGRPGAGPAAGASWQAPSDNASPDLDLFAGIQALEPLRQSLSAVPLVKMFETRRRRQLQRLELPTAQVDIAFDEGMIEAATGQRRFREIGLLLQSGDAGALYDIAMRLLELAPVQVGCVSVARRGYALACGIAIKAEKAAASTLTAASAVDDMIAAVLDGCRSHLQANHAVAGEGCHPDGVHQMRVALRRMRSAFSLLHRELPSPTMRSLGAEAKWAADALGPARAWDVFLMTTLTGPEAVGKAGSDFDGLREVSQGPRAAAYASVRELLDAPRYTAFQLSLGQCIARRSWRNEMERDGLGVLAEPASMMAVRILARLRRRACKQGTGFRRLSATGRHELRITLKKLRYATEFFLPLFGDPLPVPRYLRRLGRLQEALGLDQDAATTQPLLDELGQLSQSPGMHRAIGVVIGWQARDGMAGGERLAGRWRRFKALPPFWAHPSGQR